MNAVRPLLALALVAVAALPALPAIAAPAAPPVKKPTPIPSPGGNASGPTELVEDTEGMKINWTTGRLTVAGIGVPGDRGSLSFKRTLSARAALADAYRRLASALDVVRVDSNTRVKDLAVTDDSLRTRLNEFVKSAKVLETNYWPDGSAEIVLGADLKGMSSLQSLIAGAGKPATPASPAASASPEPAATPAPSATPNATPTKEIVTAPVPLKATFSSLIVDARGLGAQPALIPNLRDVDGKVIDLGASKHAVKYLDEGAELDPAAGLNPLKLKVNRTQGMLRADLLLTPEASNALKAALRDEKVDATAAVLIVL